MLIDCVVVRFSNRKPLISSDHDVDDDVPEWTLQKIEWFWRETLICDGMESALDRCRYKINYALPDCMIERSYVYVRCGPRNLPAQYEYWGNIRISFPDYELGDFTAGYSSLSNLDIYGAGILHEDKASLSAWPF